MTITPGAEPLDAVTPMSPDSEPPLVITSDGHLPPPKAETEPTPVSDDAIDLTTEAVESADTVESNEPVEPVESAKSPEKADLTPEIIDTVDVEPELEGFAALGLRRELLQTLESLGYDEPTPIQRETIPQLLARSDLLGQAATGTGKTAAFALPILNQINFKTKAVPTALVLVPTRELAVQVSKAMESYGSKLGVKVVAVYGGQPIGRQLSTLKRGVHVVVATPGRAIDHIKRRSLLLGSIQTVVLDEADEMLDMGFTEDIEQILNETPSDRQTVMFSATLPHRINAIAKRHQDNPVRIKISKAEAAEAKALIRQSVYLVKRIHKPAALGRILDMESPTSAIVFCATRHEVDDLTVTLNGRGYRAEALHGGMDQQQRDRVMRRLRDGTAELLVATDVAARGLDVDTLSHVVNYDVPTSPESYVHRIGRVGRAGREGVAITLAEPRSRNSLRNIERLIKQQLDVSKVPTVADLRERRIQSKVDRLREIIAGDNLNDYKAVLDGLADEVSDRDIALAALRMADVAAGTAADEQDIPNASFGHDKKGRSNRFDRDRQGGRNGAPRGNGSRGGSDRGRGGASADTGYVYVGVGRRGGVRPGDLVGAIAGETHLSGSEIGPIRISDHYSVVGVPEAAVNAVVSAVKASTIKGKKAKARRFVDS